MENMETPIQMTTNVATPVGGNSFDQGSVQEVQGMPEAISESPSTTEEVVAQDTDTSSTADRLLNIAKEDGFEEALTKLSDGNLDMDVREQSSEVETEIVEDPDSENVDDISQEISPIHEQVVQLEERILRLEKENKELLERAKRSENANQMDQEIILQLALALHELAKKEEDEEQKISMFELIVTLMTYFLKEIVVDGEIEEDGREAAANTHPKSNSNSKMENVVRLMELISQKGQDGSSSPKKNVSADHVEMIAA